MEIGEYRLILNDIQVLMSSTEIFSQKKSVGFFPDKAPWLGLGSGLGPKSILGSFQYVPSHSILEAHVGQSKFPDFYQVYFTLYV